MLKSAFLNVCLVTTSLVSAQDAAAPKINWMTWSEAIEAQKAARELYLQDKKANPPPKKIFLDVYTTWCGPCKKMDANTFKKPSVIQAMNKYYYPVKLNAEQPDPITHDEHTFINPNPTLVRGRRGVHQLAASILDNQLFYPSFVVMDENTNRLVIHKGYKGELVMAGILAFYGSNEYLKYKEAVMKLNGQQKAKDSTGQPINQ
jgi:thiol-disulfide isomerase/thioredoxin